MELERSFSIEWIYRKETRFKLHFLTDVYNFSVVAQRNLDWKKKIARTFDSTIIRIKSKAEADY